MYVIIVLFLKLLAKPLFIWFSKSFHTGRNSVLQPNLIWSKKHYKTHTIRFLPEFKPITWAFNNVLKLDWWNHIKTFYTPLNNCYYMPGYVFYKILSISRNTSDLFSRLAIVYWSRGYGSFVGVSLKFKKSSLINCYVLHKS